MKKLVLFIALLFAVALGGCSSDDNVGNDPVDPVIPVDPVDPVDRGGPNPDGTYTIKGVINDYDVEYYDPDGKGIPVTVDSYRPDPVDPDSTDTYTLATGTVNPDGTFTIDLPVPPAEDLVDNGGVFISRSEIIYLINEVEVTLACHGGTGTMILIYAKPAGTVDGVVLSEGWNVASISGGGISEGNGIENDCEWGITDLR